MHGHHCHSHFPTRSPDPFEPGPGADYGGDEDDFYDDPPPRITFSAEELLHLGGSILVLSLAFAMSLACMQHPPKHVDATSLGTFLCSVFLGAVGWDKVLAILPWSMLIVIAGFMLHELAHKVAAMRMSMFAEFRAYPMRLGLALLVSGFTGVVIAAPGAVEIYGRPTDRQSGIISIVGPAVNIAIGFAAVPFISGRGGFDFFQILAFINAFLAAFNMLPIDPLDGSKVWRWSKGIYLLTAALIILLFAFVIGVDWNALFGTPTAPGRCTGMFC